MSSDNMKKTVTQTETHILVIWPTFPTDWNGYIHKGENLSSILVANKDLIH